MTALALGLACDPIDTDESLDEPVDARGGFCKTTPLLGTPSASGYWGGGPPQLGFDGDPATAWLSEQSTGAWLALDLGSLRVIDRVRVQWRWDYDFGEAASSVVETSADGVTWTPVGISVRERQSCLEGQASCVAPEELTFAPVNARHVRLRALQWNGGWGHVNELRVYGPCESTCTAGNCGDVVVLDASERRAVDVGAHDQPLALPRATAKRFCSKNNPLLTPGTLLLAGPHPELVDLVNKADAAMWRNPFGFARELLEVDCSDPATVFVHTTPATFDRAQYGVSSARIKAEGPNIMQRPPVGPEPAGLNGTFIRLVPDGAIAVAASDLVDFTLPPSYGKPLMPPILPPVLPQTGLNACTTPKPLELGEASPPGTLAASPWKVKHKLVKGPKEIEAEVDLDIDGEVQVKIEPCIDLQLDPVNGSTGHLGFNVRWAGNVGVKFEGKGVYKRKFELSPEADEDDAWAQAGALAGKVGKGVGHWVILVPTPAGVPLPVVLTLYPILELELAVGGEASFEAEAGAKGVQFAGVRIAKGEQGPTATPYYGGHMEKDLDADNLAGEAGALWEVRANVKLEVKASVLDSLDAKAAIMTYGSVEQKLGAACDECKLELGAEAVVGLGGHLPFKLVPGLDWEVEWSLWNPKMTWTHPGMCTGSYGSHVPPLDPAIGSYTPVKHDGVGAPKRCPFKPFMLHGPGDEDADTTCAYPPLIYPNHGFNTFWDHPGATQIAAGGVVKPDLKAILVETWMENVPEWNIVTMAPGWGFGLTTQWTPWVEANKTKPDLQWQDFDAGLQINHSAVHQPSAKWFKVPQGVDFFGDYIHFHTSAFNMRVIGAQWADNEVQLADERRFCTYDGVPQTPPAIPDAPFSSPDSPQPAPLDPEPPVDTIEPPGDEL